MTRRDVAALVVRMAVENPQWGYTRIRGALSNLGHEIARTTVKRILHDHGIDPAPERSRRMPWKTFRQAHWETTYSATSTEHDVPRDAASVATAPERRSWMSASPVTSVRRQPPRTVRERPRPSARMVTGLSSATPQSSDSPTHMIQSVDASASQTRHRSCAHRVTVPGSRPLARHDAARAAHFFAWHHAHRAGAAAPTSTRRQGLRGGDRAPSAQVNVDLADVARALDHRRARCEERTPVATEGERFRRARGATIPAKSAAKLTPRPRWNRSATSSRRPRSGLC